MRKLIAVGMLVGGFLAGAVPAMAQQGGIGDPLTLAASGVVIPYVTAAGLVSTVQIASPVSNNPNLHMQFFDANCDKVGSSVGLPLTTNDIAFQTVNAPSATCPITAGCTGTVPEGTRGLVAISGVGPDGFTSIPLEAPIHAKVFSFNSSDGTSRLWEPIILDTAEFPGNPHTWSPLRTAATFFSPPLNAFVHTHLFLICPKATIQDAAGTGAAYFGHGPGPLFSNTGFPLIAPPFPGSQGSGPAPHALRVRIYDANEFFLRNTFIACTCFTELDLENPGVLPVVPLQSPFPGIDAVYASPVVSPGGTYTELEEDPTAPTPSSFTGYTSVFTVGSPLNNFFGRLNNGSRPSIEGTLTNAR